MNPITQPPAIGAPPPPPAAGGGPPGGRAGRGALALLPAPAQAQRGNFLILSATATEGGDLSFQVSGAATGEGAPTGNVTATCTASAGPTNPASPADLRATAGDTGPAATFPTATLTFTPANYTTPQRCVFYTYDDNLLEPDETITVTLSVSGGDAIVNAERRTNLGTIEDNDDVSNTPRIAIAVDDADTTEGDTAVFTVTLGDTAPAPGSPISVSWTVGGDATADDDYTISGADTDGTLAFTALGDQTLSFAIAADNLNEAAETVTVTLSGAAGAVITTASASAAIAASDPITATVDADSTAQLFTGATAEFTVALSVPSAAAVTVAYAVSGVVTDSGSLDFPPGATARPLSVAIPQDAIAGGGTGDLTVTLGAITVGAGGGTATAAAGNNAVVTVLGDNPAERSVRLEAPLASSARGIGMLASQAVVKRLTAFGAGGNTLTVAGQNMAGDGMETLAAQYLAGGGELSAEEMLRQSGFSFTSGDGGRGFNFWGGGSYVSADGDHDGVTYDGDTTAFHVGVDTNWRDGLIGIAIGTSDGDTDFTVTADGMKSKLETDVTSVHPYLTRRFSNSQLWLTAGYGSGDAELKEDDAVIKTDLTVTTAAFGITHALGDQLAARAGAIYSRAELDAATGDGKSLPATDADSTRLTAGLEAAWLAGPWRLFLASDARHDSGDGDTGGALDLGGGVEWKSPTVFVRLEGGGHLLGQDAADESSVSFTARKSTGRVTLGLNLGADETGLDTARLLHGEWRF